MNIEKFDRSTCRVLRRALEDALKNVGIEGVTFDVGGMRFSDTECTVKVVAKTAGNGAHVADLLSMEAKFHGIASTQRNGWTLVDFHPKKHKYPFIATNENGSRYKLSISQAKMRFGAVS